MQLSIISLSKSKSYK